MNCVEIELLLAEYVDGTLSPVERGAVEQHLTGCAMCREYAADLQAGMQWLTNAVPVEPPPELVAKILFETQSGRHGTLKPQSWWRRILGPVIEPILQPRLAMGMALTILSFSMVARLTGVQVTEIKASDLHPQRVWVELENRVHRSWQEVVKKYENLRLVLLIQQQLNDWAEEEEEARKAKPVEDANSAGDAKGGDGKPGKTAGGEAR